jgi:hypothetical protein
VKKLVIPGVVLAITLLAAPHAFAQDAAPVCVAAAGVAFGGNDGSTFAVQNSPINSRGIGMTAQPDGLHLTLAKPAQDADLIFYSTTLGAVIDHGVKLDASGNTSVNLWFDTNKDGRFFDLGSDGTGTFNALAGDDFGSLGKDAAGKATISALGAGTLTKQNEPLTAIDTDTAGKINRDTRVAVDVLINAPATAGTVAAVDGHPLVTCTTPKPTVTPTPTPTAAPTVAPTSTVAPTVAPVTTAPSSAGFSQIGTVPAGVDTGRA